MLLGKIERYSIWKEPEGLRVEMRQAKGLMGAIKFVGVAMVVILVVVGFKEFGLLGWCFVASWALVSVFFFLSASYEEDWWFTSDEIRYVCASRRRDERFPRPSGSPVAMQVEFESPDREAGSILGHVLRLMGPSGEDLGCEFCFQVRACLDQFVNTLRPCFPIDVEDLAPEFRKPGPKPKSKPSWGDTEDAGFA
jgi:hypothetical protein